jgi:NAD(P)-dependent dehydrogenase (short-subunit alcohol dehydrogenase family)
VALNLLAPLYCAQAANAVMQGQADGGSIVNIASVSGLRPSPGTAAYGAAKAGLINLTQSLAIEWAPAVRVNSVTAGLVATDAAEDHYGGPEGMAEVAATVPLGRFGTPADVAGLCLFLASPLADYVTGANLVAHGGGEVPAFLTAAARSAGGNT